MMPSLREEGMLKNPPEAALNDNGWLMFGTISRPYPRTGFYCLPVRPQLAAAVRIGRLKKRGSEIVLLPTHASWTCNISGAAHHASGTSLSDPSLIKNYFAVYHDQA